MTEEQVLSSPADTAEADNGITPVKTRSTSRRGSALMQRTPSLTDTPIPVLTPPAASPRSRAPQKVSRLSRSPARGTSDALGPRSGGVQKSGSKSPTRSGRAAAAERIARANKQGEDTPEPKAEAAEAQSADVSSSIQEPVKADDEALKDVTAESGELGKDKQATSGDGPNTGGKADTQASRIESEINAEAVTGPEDSSMPDAPENDSIDGPSSANITNSTQQVLASAEDA